MDELRLTQRDKDRIKVQIKLTQIIVLLFTIVLILLLVAPVIVSYLFGINFADGWIRRGLFILGGLSLPMIAVSLWNGLKFVDLRLGKKIRLETANYEIVTAKDGPTLQIRAPLKLKLDLYDNLPLLLKPGEPVIIEIAKRSKMLLSITQGGDNLLEIMERESDSE